jgi:hypothetical protein
MTTLLTLAVLLLQEASPERIQELIRGLGAEDYAAREEATKELRRIGEPAREALRRAMKESGDPEVRERAKALLEPEAPKPAPERRPGIAGASVRVSNVNGDATYVITPGDGSPALTFSKSASGAVRLEVPGGKRTVEAPSLEAFLKEHAELAARYGISEEGIDYGGSRIPFKGGAVFDFGPRFTLPKPDRLFPFAPRGAAFGPVDGTLREQLEIPEGEGAVVLQVVPGGPAEGLGLRRHDVLLELDGRPVASAVDADRRLRSARGATVLRKGKRTTLGDAKRDF